MSQAFWLGKLAHLRKARENAPHKPLMLLVFLETIERIGLVDGKLWLTADLGYRFDTYFEVARYRRTARPDVRYPFYHLSSEKFWSPRTETGELSRGRSTNAFVIPDPDFLDACQDASFRLQARCVLIETHFEPAERNALYHLVGMDVPAEDTVARNAFLRR